MLSRGTRRLTRPRFINSSKVQYPYGMMHIRHASAQNLNDDDKQGKPMMAKKVTPDGALGVARKYLINTTKSIGLWSLDLMRNPGQIPSKCSNLWTSIKKEAHHYWLGSKLLVAEVKIASGILQRVVQGHGMTRRERLQLMRTTTDLFRLVPFLVIALIPFMEFLLPVILKVFPNLLPSTFLEKSEKDNRIKQELQTRLAVAEFFQTAMTSLAKQQNKRDKDGSAQELLQFIEKSRTNETIPNEQVMRMARLFNDELTLPNLSESQLRALCKYMGLPLYGNAAILRYQIRSKLRNIIEDDKRIIYEGVDSLTTTELAEACRERGMRGHGLTSFHLKRQLRDWIELSTTKSVPIFILIMSRAFSLHQEHVPEVANVGNLLKPEVPTITASKTETSAKEAQVEDRLGSQPGVPSTETEPVKPAKPSKSSPKVIDSEDVDVIRESLLSLDPVIVKEVALAAANASENLTPEITQLKLDSLTFQKEKIEEERRVLDAKKKAKQEKLNKLIEKEKAQQESIGGVAEATVPTLESSTSSIAVEKTPSENVLVDEADGGRSSALKKEVEIDEEAESMLEDHLEELEDKLERELKELEAQKEELSIVQSKHTHDAMTRAAKLDAEIEMDGEKDGAGSGFQLHVKDTSEVETTSKQASKAKKDSVSKVDARPEVDQIKDAEAIAKADMEITVKRFEGLVEGMLSRIQSRIKKVDDDMAKEKMKGKTSAQVGTSAKTDLITPVHSSKIPLDDGEVFTNSKEKESDFEYTPNTSLQLSPYEMEAALKTLLKQYTPNASQSGEDTGKGVHSVVPEDEDSLADVREELDAMIRILTGRSNKINSNGDNHVVPVSSTDNNARNGSQPILKKESASAPTPSTPKFDDKAIEALIQYHQQRKNVNRYKIKEKKEDPLHENK